MQRFRAICRRLLGISDRPVEDNRGGRLVAVIECILNQNARDRGAASFPAMQREVIQLCDEFGVGLVQMPCPEIACLGFDRPRAAGESIRQALATHTGHSQCRQLSRQVVDRLQVYRNQGYRLLAVLGGNRQSPGCAVHAGGERELQVDSGIFMQELQAELLSRDWEVPFRGIRDADPRLLAEDLDWLRILFSSA